MNYKGELTDTFNFLPYRVATASKPRETILLEQRFSWIARSGEERVLWQYYTERGIKIGQVPSNFPY